MKWLREFRLIPIALAAIASLLVLKVAGLVLDGGYTLGERLNRSESIVVTTVPASIAVKLRSETVPLNIATASTAKPWAQEVLNYPEVTGSVPSAKPPAAPAASKPSEPPVAKPPETQPAVNIPAAERPISAVERAVLERLQERRQQLDARARELDMRENLLKAVEQKMERPMVTAQDQTAPRDGPAPAPRTDEPDPNRFKALVTIYETMKPKDAAKIFDRLDIKVLIEMSSMINPKRMSEILAAMTPEAAERLTVELAARARHPGGTQNPADLPKIEGKPIGG